jgi:hypothetical protein
MGKNLEQQSTNRIQKRRDRALRQKIFLDALRACSWNLSEACRMAKIHRSTFYLWLRENKSFADKVDAIREERIDFAESKLMEKVAEGHIIAILFFLKCQGKQRGWMEDQKVVIESINRSISKKHRDAIVNAAIATATSPKNLLPQTTKTSSPNDVIDIEPALPENDITE